MSEYSKPASYEIPPEPVPETQITETLTSDVVVVGEGLAGLCAALASLNGLAVRAAVPDALKVIQAAK